MKKGTRPHILIIFTCLSIYFGLVGNSFANMFDVYALNSKLYTGNLINSLLLINVRFTFVGLVGFVIGFCLVWLFWVWAYLVYKPEREGEEHGSAVLGTLEEARKFSSEGDDNVILSENIKLGYGKSILKKKYEILKYDRNKNVCVVGDSGSGKTRFFITPNVMQMNIDTVVTDPKGGVLAQCGKMLESQGVRIKSFNTFDPSQSCHYNPLRYVRTDIEVLEFAEFLSKNLKDKNAGKSNDPFWDDASKKLYSALIPYLRDWCMMSDYTLPQLVHLLSMAKCKEENEDYRSPLDILFDEIRYGVRETNNTSSDEYEMIDGIEFVSGKIDSASVVNKPLPLEHEVTDKQGNVIKTINPYQIYLEHNFGKQADKKIEQTREMFFVTSGLTLEKTEERRHAWIEEMKKYVPKGIGKSVEAGYRLLVMSQIADKQGYPSAKDNPLIKAVFNDNGECDLPIYDDKGLPVYDIVDDLQVLRTETYLDFALHNYNDFKINAGKTVKSILGSANVNLTAIVTREIAEILSYDEMELERLGEDTEQKTAIFAICKDIDSTLSFLTGMLMWQTMNVLCTKALSERGQHLKKPVQILLDEFVNMGYMPNIEKYVAVVRSRWVFLMFILQNLSQLDHLYSKEIRETITNNCAAKLYLGINDNSTAKDTSEGFGSGTIHTRNYNKTRGNNGSTSENNSSIARKVMTEDEIKRLDFDKCIVEISHTSPFVDKKFDISKHKNYMLLDDGQAGYKFENEDVFSYPVYLQAFQETWTKNREKWCKENEGQPTADIVDIRNLPYVNNSWISY